MNMAVFSRASGATGPALSFRKSVRSQVSRLVMQTSSRAGTRFRSCLRWRSNTLTQESIFVPRHGDDYDVENRYCHQPQGVRNLKPEELICDEDPEHQH